MPEFLQISLDSEYIIVIKIKFVLAEPIFTFRSKLYSVSKLSQKLLLLIWSFSFISLFGTIYKLIVCVFLIPFIQCWNVHTWKSSPLIQFGIFFGQFIIRSIFYFFYVVKEWRAGDKSFMHVVLELTEFPAL